jgi:hypothetical protein
MQASVTQEQHAEKSLWDRLPFPFGQRPWWVDGTTHLLQRIEEVNYSLDTDAHALSEFWQRG